MAAAKKIPMRMCIGCGEMKSKKELIRILKTSEGEFVVDTTERKNGRGAYLCASKECFEKCMKNHSLERSFKMKISSQVYEDLKASLEEKI